MYIYTAQVTVRELKNEHSSMGIYYIYIYMYVYTCMYIYRASHVARTEKFGTFRSLYWYMSHIYIYKYVAYIHIYLCLYVYAAQVTVHEPSNEAHDSSLQ